MKNKTHEVWISILAILFISVFILGITYLLSSKEKSFFNVKNISFGDILDEDSSLLDSLVEPEDSLVETVDTDIIEEAMENETQEEAEQIEQENVNTIEETFVAIHKTDVLHVRSGPSLQDSIIAYLQPGDSGKVVEKGEEWTLVSFEQNSKEISGFVYNQYLKFSVKE